MKRVLTALVLVANGALGGCKAGVPARPVASVAAAPVDATCAALGGQVLRFGAVLEEASQSSQSHRASYAGVLEMLLTLERDSADLEARLGAIQATDAALRESIAHASAALHESSDFARVERERIEQRAASILPLAKEVDAAYPELRAACDGKRAPRECSTVKEILVRSEAAGFASQVSGAEELSALRLASPVVARTRDRAVAATRALAKSAAAQTLEMEALTKRWTSSEKNLGAAFDAFGARCKSAPSPLETHFLSDARPDPRKLTLLVRVTPPAGIDEAFEELAAQAKDEDTRAFYEARSRGAFGSGFVLVRETPKGVPETLVITNRHVVESADRAALELADGTSLGPAEIVYTDAVHDVAVLRPMKKLPFDKGFAFSTAAAKDQQGVIATGFPGMAGRPSYQTTRGYVSNESFRIEDAAKPLVYVQHTAPIDPGSSGGPLTDERGFVLGVNTLKVTNREAVGLAVPAESILETIRRSDAAEEGRSSALFRRESARLACLGFVAELATKKPRMLFLETMISNRLTSSDGLASAMAMEDPEFLPIWQSDSIRAMRIAILVRLGAITAAGGGTSALETCADVNADDSRDVLTTEEIRYRVRLASGEARDVSFRYEQGHWKLGRMDLRPPKPTSVAAKLAPITKPGLPKPRAKKK